MTIADPKESESESFAITFRNTTLRTYGRDNNVFNKEYRLYGSIKYGSTTHCLRAVVEASAYSEVNLIFESAEPAYCVFVWPSCPHSLSNLGLSNGKKIRKRRNMHRRLYEKI